ncbi:hypothetical protein SeLEV6574_g06154, partial [Synchytrium endobioticum]
EYHALVFEKLKTLFMKLQWLIGDTEDEGRRQQIEEGLALVWTALKKHHGLVGKCRILKYTGKLREVKLPYYDMTRPGAKGPMIAFDDDRLREYIQKITNLQQTSKNQIDALLCTSNLNAEFDDAAYRFILNANRSWLRRLESTSQWQAPWDYKALQELALEDRRWLPLCLAHERLIITRARNDITQLELYMAQYPQDHIKVSIRLSEFANFIEGHKGKINDYKTSLRGLDALERNCVNDEVSPSAPFPPSLQLLEWSSNPQQRSCTDDVHLLDEAVRYDSDDRHLQILGMPMESTSGTPTGAGTMPGPVSISPNFPMIGTHLTYGSSTHQHVSTINDVELESPLNPHRNTCDDMIFYGSNARTYRHHDLLQAVVDNIPGVANDMSCAATEQCFDLGHIVELDNVEGCWNPPFDSHCETAVGSSVYDDIGFIDKSNMNLDRDGLRTQHDASFTDHQTTCTFTSADNSASHKRLKPNDGHIKR